MNAHSKPRVGTWIDSFAARQILAAADRQNFHQYRRPAMWGEDHLDWVASDENGDAVVAELSVLRERALYGRTGYANLEDSWRDGKAGAEAYLDAAGRIPTISDALEAEFARREGRGVRVRATPTRAEVDALKALVGAGLEGRAH